MTGTILDFVGAVFVFIGAVLSFGAAVALVRFPDVLGKLHAITKPQVLGLIFVSLGVAVPMPGVEYLALTPTGPLLFL